LCGCCGSALADCYHWFNCDYGQTTCWVHDHTTCTQYADPNSALASLF
jgi:hypothetical protein